MPLVREYLWEARHPRSRNAVRSADPLSLTGLNDRFELTSLGFSKTEWR
jgi:hypothetical protein